MSAFLLGLGVAVHVDNRFVFLAIAKTESMYDVII